MSKTNSEIEDLPKFHALIAAAGSGNRFQSETPKQYLKIAGKSLLRHSIDAFLNHPQCSSVKVIINPQDAGLYHEATKSLEIEPYSEGSRERKLSIYNGLKDYSKIKNKDIILIHDAVRACISKDEITDLLKTLKTHQAASLALPISATLARTNDESLMEEQIERKKTYALQTPQGFRYGDILKAHENSGTENYTDDTALVSRMGIPVKLVTGKPTNIKITYPEDFHMAEAILNVTAQTRTGQGFDVHAFDTDKPGPVRLCGINIEHEHALKGHSDADVGLHALTDAILGAIGEGDIGQHFPPSDNTYKDMDSAFFLEKTIEMLNNKGGTLQNADITLICEEPKIGPHTQKMKIRIAEICDCPPEQINIKATTTEQLGFTGRKEGIAAQAIATVKL